MMTDEEIHNVTDAVSSGWGPNCFNYIEKFKEKLRDYLVSNNVWLTTSCHGAIHTVLMAIGIGPSDEVIVPDFTWVGTANPVKWLGGEVVLCDVNKQTACIDPLDFEKKINSNTKAVIVVHIFGNMCDMDQILNIAKKHGIFVIEDCAGAFGSSYNGRKAGTIGDFGVYSFNGTKIIVTGEGGAITANNEKFVNKINLISDQGRDRSSNDSYAIQTLGLKYNISNIQAALGLGQLSRIQQILDKKRHLFKIYQKELSNHPDLILQNFEDQIRVNNFWLPTLLVKTETIDPLSIVKHVNSKGADIRSGIYTLSRTAPYKHLSVCKNSDFLAKRTVNLCSYEEMADREVIFICETIKEYIKRA